MRMRRNLQRKSRKDRLAERSCNIEYVMKRISEKKVNNTTTIDDLIIL